MSPDRVLALSEQLVHVHDALRERLAGLRQEAAAGARFPDDLLSHCVGFCSALATHHTGEDGQLLPELRRAAPELGPVIDKLMEDHRLVAGILRQIQAVLAEPADAGTLVRELDGLTAILESHFGYEERRIASAMDSLAPGAWVAV